MSKRISCWELKRYGSLDIELFLRNLKIYLPLKEKKVIHIMLKNRLDYCNVLLIFINATSRSNYPEVFCKKGVFKNLLNTQDSTYNRVSFLKKMQASGLELY